MAPALHYKGYPLPRSTRVTTNYYSRQQTGNSLPPCMVRSSPLPMHFFREAASGQTARSFGQQLRTTALLAAETDLSRVVVPCLARAISAASQHELASGGVLVHSEGSHTHKTPRRTFREAHFNGLERLPRNPRECDRRNEDVALWAPVLAVCRSVDAVVSGVGRPRMNFTRRSSTDFVAGGS